MAIVDKAAAKGKAMLVAVPNAFPVAKSGPWAPETIMVKFLKLLNKSTPTIFTIPPNLPAIWP